jgi:hypothetical protein
MVNLPETLDTFTKIARTETDQYPVHRLMQQYLEKEFDKDTGYLLFP